MQRRYIEKFYSSLEVWSLANLVKIRIADLTYNPSDQKDAAILLQVFMEFYNDNKNF